MPTRVRTTILSISPCADDHAALAEILQSSKWPLCRANTFPAAMQLVRSHQISVIVSERDLPPYSWTDLLGAVAASPKPPLVIVASRHADDYLWAEALNLGAHDVLAKPFDPPEVRRAVRFAVLRWRWNREPALPPLAMAAGRDYTS